MQVRLLPHILLILMLTAECVLQESEVVDDGFYKELDYKEDRAYVQTSAHYLSAIR